ncbi:MAG TPA: MbnP family protein [Bacteroidia bacterium]|jgi:hypothetical protein|nr:MbnP family protein [Bacteroidia bacterium]
MNKFYFILITLLPFFGFCQKDTGSVKFTPTFGNTAIEPGKKYYSSKLNDSLNIETFRFYVSNLTLLKNGKVVYTVKNKFHLIDIEKKLSISFLVKKIDFDVIKFNIGIDSTTNVSGAMGGDLDPVNGMYWAWQSGYINFKLEGAGKVCATRNNIFQFHIGGYLNPYATLQTITLSLKNKTEIDIKVDLEKFLNGIDLKNTNEIMSPGEKAVTLAKLYQTIFSVKE